VRDDARCRSPRAELAGASSSAEYLALRVMVSQDKDKLLNGITEMRYCEGEKHIVFLAEHGIALDEREEDQIMARSASDARIVLNTIVTGGIPATTLKGRLTSATIYNGPVDMSLPLAPGVNLGPGQVMKALAAETGGGSPPSSSASTAAMGRRRSSVRRRASCG
jgi:hypothetical protein